MAADTIRNRLVPMAMTALARMKNQIFVFMLKGAGAGLAIALNVAITRSLALPDAGAMFMAISIITIVYALARLGFGYTTAKLVAFHSVREDNARLKGSILTALEAVLASSLFFGLVMYLAPKLAIARHGASPELLAIIPIFAIAVPIFCVGSMAAEVLKGLQRPIQFTVIDSIVQKVVSAVLIIALARSGGLVAAAWGYVAGIVAAATLAGLLAFKAVPIATRSVQALYERKATYGSAAYFSVLSYGTVIGQWATPLIVGWKLSQSQSALYFAAYRTSAVVEFILISASAVIGPIFIKVLEREGRNALYKTTYRTALMTFGSAAMIAVPMLIGAYWIMMLYGPQFTAATSALRILLAAQLLAAPSGVFLYTLIALHRERLVAITTPIAVVAGLSAVFILSDRYGLAGAAFGQGLFVVGQNLLVAALALTLKKRRVAQSGQS